MCAGERKIFCPPLPVTHAYDALLPGSTTLPSAALKEAPPAVRAVTPAA